MYLILVVYFYILYIKQYETIEYLCYLEAHDACESFLFSWSNKNNFISIHFTWRIEVTWKTQKKKKKERLHGNWHSWLSRILGGPRSFIFFIYLFNWLYKKVEASFLSFYSGVHVRRPLKFLSTTFRNWNCLPKFWK